MPITSRNSRRYNSLVGHNADANQSEMPPSPVRRLEEDAVLRKRTNAVGLGKSASESALKARQQGCLRDQELLALERDDGKRHSRELSVYLSEYTKKIDELEAKNRRLEEELSFDERATREDPYFNEQLGEKLSNLYTQGNNVMIRLELERKEVARLNRMIQHKERVLAQQKAKLYELASLDNNHRLLIARLRKMENEIDRRIVKMNEKLNQNRSLRQSIDAHRAERARMDAIYTKISTETLAKRQKVARLSQEVEKQRDEVADIEQDIENLRLESEEWEQTCDRRAALLLQELKEVAVRQANADELVDVDKYKYLGENDIMRNLSAAHESVMESRVSRTRWKTGQAKIATDVTLTKYQENRTFIEKIHEVSGTKTVSEMIDAFNNQEIEHFDRIQHVNQLAEDIENHRLISGKLREEIGKLKQRKDSVDFQRVNRIEGLKSRLQFTNDQKKHKEEANHELQGFLAGLKPAILLLHSRIGCADVHGESDMKKILGDIEEQIVVILQKFNTKTEAKKMELLAKESNNALRTPGSSPSRKTPLGLKLQPGEVHPQADDDANTATEGLSPPPLNLQAIERAKTAAVATIAGSAGDTHKALDFRTISALLAKEQPYRYTGLRPPHLSMDELKKKDNVEEEYPLTYDELKAKVWLNDSSH